MAVQPYGDPRAQVVPPETHSGQRPAFYGPYTDHGLTTRNPVQTSLAVDPLDEQNLGETTVYNIEGVDHQPDNSDVAVKPNSPNSWKVGRDPYAIDGMVGQDFFKKSSG